MTTPVIQVLVGFQTTTGFGTIDPVKLGRMAAPVAPVAPADLGTNGSTNIAERMVINVNAGLVSSPDQIGQQIIESIQKAERRSGPVFARAS